MGHIQSKFSVIPGSKGRKRERGNYSSDMSPVGGEWCGLLCEVKGGASHELCGVERVISCSSTGCLCL